MSIILIIFTYPCQCNVVPIGQTQPVVLNNCGCIKFTIKVIFMITYKKKCISIIFFTIKITFFLVFQKNQIIILTICLYSVTWCNISDDQNIDIYLEMTYNCTLQNIRGSVLILIRSNINRLFFLIRSKPVKSLMF